MSVLGEWEAKLIAAPGGYQDKPVGTERSLGMREFDLCYVFWREFPQAIPRASAPVTRRPAS